MSYAHYILIHILITLTGMYGSSLAQQTTPGSTVPIIGIDSNYAVEMEGRRKEWIDGRDTVDPFRFFAKQGCTGARIRLWVGRDGVNQLAYATETARRAQKAGLKPCLVIFLSDSWADLVKQPVPAEWQGLSADGMLATIEKYAEDVTRHFAANGVQIDTYEIGNEIDFGICGVFEEEWKNRVNIEFMRQNVWPRMVPILKAAQKGISKAQPNATFILHLAQWNNLEYCLAFWQSMVAAGVQVDFAGLSYFPTSAEKPEYRPLDYLKAQTARVAAVIRKPVVICEFGYPAVPTFGGQFSNWNHPAQGYTLSDIGQARWITDFLALVRRDHHIAAVYYWSPEWYDGQLWDAFALFDTNGKARSGARALSRKTD